MKEARELFSRYLAQRRSLGDADLLLDPEVVTALREPIRATSAEKTLRERAFEEPPRASSTIVPPIPTSGPVSIGTHTGWDELRTAALGCTACGLADSRTNVVFGDGDPSARLVVVGEAPGANEDQAGLPFVGRAGKLLDLMLASIGYPRSTVYICNVLKCRPPGNRNPTPGEVAACSGFLRRQVEIIRPKAILAVGTFSAQTLLGTDEPIGRLRGAVHEYEGVPLIPTYHPAALLRNSSWVRPVWGDLQRLRSILDA